MTDEQIRAPGGWCLPEIPAISVNRGGIQWPRYQDTRVTVSRSRWWHRWLVTRRTHREYADGRVEVDVVSIRAGWSRQWKKLAG